jgi:GT2 family glycosyltransferase
MTAPDLRASTVQRPVRRPLFASVLIPTYNRRRLLLETLESLEHQTLPQERLEVIVAVDGSSDDTVDALKGFRPRYTFRWLYQANQGCAAASNAAARQAQHQVLIFLDDDQIAAPELVAVHVRVQEERGPVLVQGFYPLAPGYDRRGASLIYERSLMRSLAPTDGAHPSTAHIWSANISVMRETFDRIGGFDETFRDYGGEDTDFGLRVAALGVPVVFEPTALSYHQHDVSYRSVRRQAFSAGKSLVHLAEKHAVPLSTFSGGEMARYADRQISAAWRRSPRTMEILGRTLMIALRCADALRLRPVQLGIARLVHRYYKVGGIAVESRKLEGQARHG